MHYRLFFVDFVFVAVFFLRGVDVLRWLGAVLVRVWVLVAVVAFGRTVVAAIMLSVPVGLVMVLIVEDLHVLGHRFHRRTPQRLVSALRDLHLFRVALS